MGCEVYANDDEIACKAGDGKVIAAFPDVCLSPPSPPAGPIPVPYPDTSFSKDMQNGSKTVMIKDQEVMLITVLLPFCMSLEKDMQNGSKTVMIKDQEVMLITVLL